MARSKGVLFDFYFLLLEVLEIKQIMKLTKFEYGIRDGKTRTRSSYNRPALTIPC